MELILWTREANASQHKRHKGHKVRIIHKSLSNPLMIRRMPWRKCGTLKWRL